jgi:hypothetical protein
MAATRLAAASAFLAGLAALTITASAGACPTDTQARAPATLLTLQLPGSPARAFSAADLQAQPPSSLTQRQMVTAGGGISTERSLVYSGVLMRDLLIAAGYGGPADRGARTGVIEATATDGYRAVFSWGEIFNTGAGEQVLVITSQDGKALDAAAGPLALRALGDLRPGSRHVRNLCALIVRNP